MNEDVIYDKVVEAGALRDFFAGCVIAGLAANREHVESAEADKAYRVADLMLRARTQINERGVS